MTFGNWVEMAHAWPTPVRTLPLGLLLGLVLQLAASDAWGGYRIVAIRGDRFEISVGSSQGVAVGLTGRVVDPSFRDENGRPLAMAFCRITAVRPTSAEGEVTEIGSGNEVIAGMEVEFDRPLVAPRGDREAKPVQRSTQPDRRPFVPSGFVLVNARPPVRFTMGSPTDDPGRDSDETEHEVTLTRSFCVSDHEVTQGEWELVMGWNDSSFRGSNRPVEGVTWFDAVRYCNERSIREGYTPVYTIMDPRYEGNHITAATVVWNESADGYRLLTEAEWEYACRATSQTAFCNGGIVELSCGNDPNLTQVGWYCGNSRDETHDVGGKAANLWGIRDMHGNVWEWCWDWWGSYGGNATDPVGPASGSVRVLRGGSWSRYAQDCRSAARDDDTPGNRFHSIGLRVARTVR